MIKEKFWRKLKGLMPMDEVALYLKDYHRRWVQLVKENDSQADDYYDDICHFFKTQKVPYVDLCIENNGYHELVIFVYYSDGTLIPIYFSRNF